tara:strand:- start:300 stop:521 length:222 start_codon:yes stop_codon:yes gene_type:complete
VPQIGDIVKVLGTNEKKIIVDSRMEIIPASGDWSGADNRHDLCARVTYELAGKPDRWFTIGDIEILSARRTAK